MSVESSINETTDNILTALTSHEVTDAEKEMIAVIVGKLLIKTVEKSTTSHLRKVDDCCGIEIDLAHQIREQINREKDVLISNLTALR
jgi:hypothetical protein